MSSYQLIGLIIAVILLVFGVKTFHYWKEGYGFNQWGMEVPWGPFKPANKFQKSLTLWFSVVFCLAGIAIIMYIFF